MISFQDYLQLLPKTELHCHFVSTLTAGHFIRLAAAKGVELPTTDPAALFDFPDLVEFLVAFRKAHQVLTEAADLAEVGYEGVRHAVRAGNLRYREYYINPQYFQRQGMGYRQLMAPVIDGLRAAERDFGVGFRIVISIDRQETASSAEDLVADVLANRYDEVVGVGMDDLTPEKTEDPMRFRAAIATAKKAGMKTAAHVGETDNTNAQAVRHAIFDLGVDRIDHGYRIMDDPELVRHARESQIPFATTPVSTTICSGWSLNPDHRIAQMIRAGLNVTVSTDDAMFFRTDIGREYSDALHSFGVTPQQAKTIALAGIDAAFCDDETKRRLRAEFNAGFLALDELLTPTLA